ncbi:MAG: hypothetical protein IKE70_04355, partial [Bacilli bacterium]|nr:hypothetical protein [Bacilli bacterium]
MNQRVLKQLKYNILLLSILLIIELLFIGHRALFQKKVSIYFDGMNAVIQKDSYYVGVGSNNDNSNHYEKAKISKYNEKREKTFEKLYNVGYNSAFFGVGIDKEDMIAVGSYEKNDTNHEESVRTALIVKYSSSGDIIFEKDYSLLDNSKFTKIYVVEDGYIVCGQSIYKNTRVGSHEGGAILVKYSRDGKLLWKQSFGDNKSAIFNDLILVDNYIYTVGIRDSYIGVICKYDLDGNFITSSDFTYTDEMGFTGVTTYQGDIYVSGSKRGENHTVNGVILHYNTDCSLIQEVSYKGEGYTRFHKIQVDSKGNFIVIGIIRTKNSLSGNKVDAFNYNGIIGKYTSSLEEVRVTSYGDERDDYFTDLSLLENDYLVVGYSSYEDGSYLSKFIRYSDALKVLGVN